MYLYWQVKSSKQKRLLRSVQSAVSRLVDPSNSTNDRRPKRVERLSMILTSPTYSGKFFSIVLDLCASGLTSAG